MRKRIISIILSIIMVIGNVSNILAVDNIQAKDQKEAIFVIERSTLGQPLYLEPTVVNYTEGDNVAAALVDVLGEENIKNTGTTESSFYLSRVKLHDNLPVNPPSHLYEVFEDKSPDDLGANEDEWLGEFDHTTFAGWIYWVNHKHMPCGMSDATLHDGDVVRLQFTLYGYGQDLGLGWGGTPVYEVANKDELITSLAYLNKDKIALTNSSKLQSLYDEGIQLLTDMIATQSEVDAAANKIQDALQEKEIDKTKLQEQIVEAKQLKEGLYTTDSWENLIQVLTEAEQINNDEEVTQEQINTITNQLKQVIAELEENTGNEGKTYKQVLNQTLEYMYANTKEPSFGTFGGEWTILALARGEYPYTKEYIDSYYHNVEKVVKDKKGELHKRKYTEYARVVLGLTAIGRDVTDIAGYSMLDYLADYDKVIWQGINGPVFALLALDSHDYIVPQEPNGKETTTREKLINAILKEEIPGGGFALYGTKPDVDVTAMTLQALSPYKQQDHVKPVIDRALEVLSKVQNNEGGFENAYGGADGSAAATSESTSQVIVALCELGINPTTDERFIKNGKNTIDELLSYSIEGGGFSHLKNKEIDAMATDQGAYALVAYDRFLNKKTSLYNMSDVKIIEEVSKDVLIKELEEIEALDYIIYTTTSWESLQKIVEEGKNVRDNVFATKQQVQEALEKLQTAVKLLKEREIEKVNIPENGEIAIGNDDRENNVQIPITSVIDKTVSIDIPNQSKKVVTLELENKILPQSIVCTQASNSISFPKSVEIKTTNTKQIGLFIPQSNSQIQQVKNKLEEKQTSTKTLDSIVSFGGKDTIHFNDFITITCKNKKGYFAGFIDSNEKFIPIAKVAKGEVPSKEEVYAYDDGNDLVIQTKHFTDFVIYNKKENEGTGGTGGGNSSDTTKYVTLSVDKLTIHKGYVIDPIKVELQSKDTAWDVLKRELDTRNIHCEYEYTPKYQSIYVQSIDGDGEFDHGRWSGWMYNVNGWYPNYGASKYDLRDGDKIEWRYTTNLGEDLGADNSQWDTWPDGTRKDPEIIKKDDAIEKALKETIYPFENEKYTKIEGISILKDKLITYQDEDAIAPWAKQAVRAASALEIVEGEKEKFEPKKQVTRAMFTKMMVKLLEKEPSKNDSLAFTDVKKTNPYAPYIQTAYELNIVKGRGDKFDPNGLITREELAVILERVLQLKETSNKQYVDKDKISPWAKEAVKKVDEYGFLTGYKGAFNPKQYITKEMTATVIVRAYQYLHAIQVHEMKQEVKQALEETSQHLVDTVTEPAVGSIGGEWAVFGLARRGASVPSNYYEQYYQRVIEEVKKQEKKTARKWKTKVTETQRIAIALAAIGKNPKDVEGIDLVDYSWNKAKNMPALSEHDQILGNRQGLNELVFGLIAVDLKRDARPKDAAISRYEILNKIIDTYTTKDGGFSLVEKQAKLDPDMTAMTLQALAPYYHLKGCEKVTNAIDTALEALAKIQTKEGGFENAFGGADGKNAPTLESTAQVIVALCSLGMDPTTDERFVKDGKNPVDDLMSYYAEGGGFKHLKDGERDQMATEQGYYALVAYERFLDGKSSIYDMRK